MNIHDTLASPDQVNDSPAENTALVMLISETQARDVELIYRFNNGEESAFVEIVENYYGKILGFTKRMLRNSADAEEVTQDTFVKAHRNLASFRGEASLSTWLYAIARNLTRNRCAYFFRRGRHAAVSFDVPFSDLSELTYADLLAAEVQTPSEELVSNELRDLIALCMDALDAPQREILAMRAVLHLSYTEIAATLSLNVGTVKSRIGRARVKLRSLVSETLPEAGLGVENLLLRRKENAIEQC